MAAKRKIPKSNRPGNIRQLPGSRKEINQQLANLLRTTSGNHQKVIAEMKRRGYNVVHSANYIEVNKPGKLMNHEFRWPERKAG